MLAFADALIKYMEDPSYSVHNLSDYIEENEGEEYEIHLRDQKTNLLFSSRRKLHGDMETQDSGSSNPGFQPEKYSGDAEPKEDKVKKNITLRKKYNFKGGENFTIPARVVNASLNGKYLELKRLLNRDPQFGVTQSFVQNLILQVMRDNQDTARLDMGIYYKEDHPFA